MAPLLLFLTAALSVLNLHTSAAFRICAFNAHHFGDSKSKDGQVMKRLVQIISRCDVCLLQEIRDSKQKALPALLAQLNRGRGAEYDFVASERLGRSDSYQEQYAFFYKIYILRSDPGTAVIHNVVPTIDPWTEPWTRVQDHLPYFFRVSPVSPPEAQQKLPY